MPSKKDRQQIYVKSRKEWRAWLAKNHKQDEAIWLIQHKKNSNKPCVTYDETAEEALCYGWIDSVVNRLDETRYLLMLSPRRPKSGWSKSNKERVARLLKQKKINKAGLAKIEAAKKDGSWTILDATAKGVVAPDLKKALNANKIAKNNFDTLAPSHKRAYLEWIDSAKKAETRATRIEKTVKAIETKKPFWQKP